MFFFKFYTSSKQIIALTEKMKANQWLYSLIIDVYMCVFGKRMWSFCQQVKKKDSQTNRYKTILYRNTYSC